MDGDGGPDGLATRVDGHDDAPVLLCCNSLGTSMAMWNPQVERWAQHHRVVRFDARGHGDSAASAPPYSLEAMGADALAVLDGHGVASADLCGLSLGGLVALWVAVHHPQRVRRLVIACSGARIGTQELWTDRADVVRRHGMSGVAAAVIDRFFSGEYRARAPETVATIERMLLDVEPEGYAGACIALAGADLRDDLPRVGASTLIIAGSDDVATPPATMLDLRRDIPDARWVEMPSAGHLANLEQPEQFTALVTAFLTGASVDAQPA